MNGTHFMGLTLLAFGTLLHGNDADAQARQPPPQWKEAAGPPVAMDVWLRRLVGRFSVEGAVQVSGNSESPAEPNAIKGIVDCVSVGTGPGVQCMLNVSWLNMYVVFFGGGDLASAGGSASAVPGAVSYLDPAVILFGLDSGKAAINHLLVDNKGLPEGGLGANKGHWATFRTSCVNQPGIVGGLREDLPHRSQGRRSTPVHVDRRRAGPEGDRSSGLQHRAVTAAYSAG